MYLLALHRSLAPLENKGQLQERKIQACKRQHQARKPQHRGCKRQLRKRKPLVARKRQPCCWTQHLYQWTSKFNHQTFFNSKMLKEGINCYDSNVFIITRCVGIASVATVIGNTTGQKRSHSSGQRVGHKSASCRLVFLFISFIVHYELWWTRVVCVLLDSQSTCCFAIWPVFTVGIGSSLDNQSRRNHRQLDIGSDYRWNKVNQSDCKGRENEHDNYSNESKRKGRRGGKELWLPPARMTWHLKRQGQMT